MIKISKSKKTKISVIGIDRRMKYCADSLTEAGYSVGVPEEYTVSEFDKCVSRANAVVLGVPASADGKYISGLGSSLMISLDHLFEKCSHTKCAVIAGAVSERVAKCAEKFGVGIFDYQKDEAYLIRNAKTTASAALSFMMNSLNKAPDTVYALIFGNGRVGGALSRTLSSVGTTVTVCARNRRDLAIAECLGLNTVDISSGIRDLPYCDIVFNTVPNMIFTPENIAALPENALICNLASQNGGFSEEVIPSLGDRYILAKSLPGKIFPETAGCELAAAVADIVERQGL